MAGQERGGEERREAEGRVRGGGSSLLKGSSMQRPGFLGFESCGQEALGRLGACRFVLSGS